MKSIRVEVTAEQIAGAGDQRMAWAAPVEAALAGLTGESVSIDGDGSADHGTIATISQGTWTLVVDLPQVASDWLNARWDDDGPGEPFDFELEVPTWIDDLIRLASPA